MLHVNRQNFVIFTHFRSGSRSLVEALRSQSISVFDEPFNKLHCMNNDDKFDNTFSKLIKEEEPLVVYSKLFKKYQGFKHIFLQLGQNDNDLLVQNYPTIFLTRRDTKLAALSFLVAELSEIWHTTKRNKDGGIRKDNRNQELSSIYKSVGSIHVENIDISRKNFERIELYREKVKNGIFVFYEDLYSSNWKEETQKIFDFIGCKIINWDLIEEIMGPNNKLNDEFLYQNIENYEEIKEYLTQQQLVDSEQASEAQNLSS